MLQDVFHTIPSARRLTTSLCDIRIPPERSLFSHRVFSSYRWARRKNFMFTEKKSAHGKIRRTKERKSPWMTTWQTCSTPFKRNLNYRVDVLYCNTSYIVKIRLFYERFAFTLPSLPLAFAFYKKYIFFKSGEDRRIYWIPYNTHIHLSDRIERRRRE